MPEFVLDTSGYVERHDGARLHWYDDLTPFVQGYIEAMMADLDATTCFPVFDDGWRRARFADLAPETLARIMKDCAAFLEITKGARAALDDGDEAEVWGDMGVLYASGDHAGRDFWYTRNGHGVGFWDGDWPEPYATALTEAAEGFGGVDAYLGDDGKVYLS